MTGEELRNLREALKLTPPAVAQAAGISRSYLVTMETREGGRVAVPQKHEDRLLGALERLGIGSEESVIRARQHIRDLNRERELAGAPTGGSPS